MPETLPLPPAASVIESSCWLPRHPKSAGKARGLLRDFLADRSGGELLLEEGELLLSELMSNAITHAQAPRDRLILARFEFTSAGLLIEVHDASAVEPMARQCVAELDECGRGLILVDALASSWGVRPREDGVGKCTWVTIEPLLCAPRLRDPEVAQADS